MRVKYPRTPHLPWSPGISSDDKVIKSLDNFYGKEIVMTEKMDGENSSLYSDYFHARSINTPHHESQTWLKQFHSQIANDIPDGWRVCGENLYAKHSIAYENLPSYFMGFSIWNEHNECLSWAETIEWFELMGVEPVNVLYIGVYNEDKIKSLWNDKGKEGYVIRLSDKFNYNNFDKCVAKYVRNNHIQTDEHWAHKAVEKNRLK